MASAGVDLVKSVLSDSENTILSLMIQIVDVAKVVPVVSAIIVG